MKKIHLPIAGLILISTLFACDNNSSNTSTTDSTVVKKSDSNVTTTNPPDNTSTTTTTTPPATNNTPLNKADSTFVMKAAMGGMMEVQAGNIAQQNAQSDRVKGFGSMMVNDHSKANDELKLFASSHGITIPSALPKDMQAHIDAMQKMKGKDFDSHYMNMMLSDHKKDVAEFEKQSKSANDPDLKNWAAKTLPTLKTHLDSAQAISKAHM